MSVITDRAVALAWQVHAGDYEDLERIVVASGGRWRGKESNSSGSAIAVTSHGITVGIPPVGDDPATCYIQVAFILFGQHWALIPEVSAGMEAVKGEWARRSRLSRDSKAPPVAAQLTIGGAA